MAATVSKYLTINSLKRSFLRICYFYYSLISFFHLGKSARPPHPLYMKDFMLVSRRHHASPKERIPCVSKTTVSETRTARHRDPQKPAIIGYARVSTKGQKHRLQIDALKAAGCTRIVKEVGSGAAWDRPLFNETINSLRPGDTLVVWRIDRWARDLLLFLQTTHDLEARGIAFRSLTEGFDATTPIGKLTMQIFGAFAEYEFQVNKIRTEAGLTAANSRGKRGGRPPALTADDIAAAEAILARTRLKVPEVARSLGVAASTLYRCLSR